MGTVETSDEDPYAIYNAVALKLKEKSVPKVEVEVDVANLSHGEFNDYNLYEKVYIKLPGTDHLITAQVDKTSKNARLMNENTVGLSNYNLQTPAITYDTWIDSSNRDFKYPNSETLNAWLVKDQDGTFLSNKLLTFTVYSIDDNNTRTFKKAYTKKTNSTGQAVLNMKLNPGEYEIDIRFGGDVEYTESSLTVEVSVGGTIEKNKNKNTTTSKTTKTTSNTKAKKRFWTKCGVSPDKKKVIGIGHYSASTSEARKYSLNYRTVYRTEFKNKCPSCGKSGTLRFDGGKTSKCINPKFHSRGYKIEWKYEHGITCYNCDADYDCTTGLNTDSRHSNKLTMLKKPVVSGETDFKKLIKGKLYYDTVKETKKTKTKTTTKTTPTISGMPSSIKKKALSLISNSSGTAAAKKIASFCGKGIGYTGYTDHRHPATWVLNHKQGNCCDQSRLLIWMWVSVGLLDTFDIYFVHCHANGKGHVFTQLRNKTTGKKVYVDPCCSSNPWGNYLTSYGPIVGYKQVTSNNWSTQTGY
jgi:hypothetical protein